MPSFRLLIIGILMLVSCNLFAQGTGQDRQRIERTRRLTDTLYIRALVNLAENVAERMPDSALTWAGQAMTLSRKANDKKSEAKANYVRALAKTHLLVPDFNAAETALSLAKADFEQLHDPIGILKCNLLEIRLLTYRDGFFDALTGLDKADSLAMDSLARPFRYLVSQARAELSAAMQPPAELELAAWRKAVAQIPDLAKPDFGKATLLSATGKAYMKFGKPDSALAYFEQAADEFEGLQAWQERMLVLSEGTLAALAARDSLKAFEHSSNAVLSIANDSLSLARVAVLTAGGLRMLSIAQPDSALRLLRRAVMAARPHKNPYVLYKAHLSLSKGYESIQDVFNAVRYADSALTLADTLRNPTLQQDAAKVLADLYVKAGDFRLAYKYQQRMILAADSLRNRREQVLRIALAAEAEYSRMQETQSEPDAVEAKTGKEWKQWLHWGLMGVAGALILALIILAVKLVRRNTRVRDLEYKLKLQEEETSNVYEELAMLEKNSGRTSANLEQLVDERTEALKRAVESLMEANEELDTFIYRASHDLLGPLAKLKGLVEIAKASSYPEDLKQSIDLISAVSIYMDRVLKKLILIREIKNYSSPPKKVDIVDMIQGMQSSLMELPGIDHPEIMIQDWLQRPVMINERNLRIVLENLLENACIFRKDTQQGNPKIEVNLKQDGRTVIIEVADVGIGIPDDIRDKVFDIFFRGSPQSKGNGLGLYLVKRALDGIGGSIAIDSKQSSFTKFTIRFPEM